jgi:hypothetical protein
MANTRQRLKTLQILAWSTRLRDVQTSQISVWSSNTVYLEVSRSRIRVWPICSKSGLNLTGWCRGAKNIQTSKTGTPEVLRRSDGRTSWKGWGWYCMWKGRVLELVVALCHALRMACASIIIQVSKAWHITKQVVVWTPDTRWRCCLRHDKALRSATSTSGSERLSYVPLTCN